VGRTCGTHGRGEEGDTGLWWESPKERDHLEDQGLNGRTGFEWILGRLSGVQSGSRLLRVGTGGGLL
jgi:hypothetical protein